MITGSTQPTPIDDAPSVLTLPSPNDQKKSQQMIQTHITISDPTPAAIFNPTFEILQKHLVGI